MSNQLTRREVLWMSALAAASFTPIGHAFAAESKTVDAGEVSKYSEDAVYPEFGVRGFFLIRRDGKLVAQSSLCTHKRCKLKPSEEGFVCSCHGSTFTLDGVVTRPPAKQDLCRFGISVNQDRHVVVDLSKQFERKDFGHAQASVDVAAASAA